MSKPQFAILRFAKYKGPEISNIEAHNERTKDTPVSQREIALSETFNTSDKSFCVISLSLRNFAINAPHFVASIKTPPFILPKE